MPKPSEFEMLQAGTMDGVRCLWTYECCEYVIRLSEQGIIKNNPG